MQFRKQLPDPVVLVPGITASALRDEYTLPPETIWSALTKEYERVALHPDDLRYETIEPARVAADQVLGIAYKELIEELRHNLREHQYESVPVYPFAYDWRQPLALTEVQLGGFIDEVIARTKLLRHYQNDETWIKDPCVNLIGHSMGGLVIAGYLAQAGKKARVAKVATLATPFRGSFEAVIQVATGTANLGTGAPSSREREAARVTPALYHLLPTCAGLTVEDRPTSKSLFERDLWQQSILDSLEEYVRLYAVDRKKPKEQAERLFSAMLKQAKNHNSLVEKFRVTDAGLSEKDWLCIAGVNSVTRIALNIVSKNGKPQFDFRGSDRDDKWAPPDSDVQSLATGDGTVPFPGAVPSFIPVQSIVCVTPEDYGYWEIQDRLTSGIAGFHGILPNMDMLHRLLVRFFTGRRDTRKNTWGRRAPGVQPGDWDPPLELEEETDLT